MTFYTAYAWDSEIKPKNIIKGYASFNEAEKNLYKDCKVNPRIATGRDMCSILCEVEGEWYDMWRSMKTKDVFGTKIDNRGATFSLHALTKLEKKQVLPGWIFRELNMPEKNKAFWNFVCPYCGSDIHVDHVKDLPNGCTKCFHHVGEWSGEVTE